MADSVFTLDTDTICLPDTDTCYGYPSDLYCRALISESVIIG